MSLARLKAKLGLLAAAVIFAIAFSVVFAGSRAKPNLRLGQVGTPAELFRLPDLNGQMVSLKSMRGDVVVLCFADAPMHSEAQIQRLAQLGRQFQSSGAVRTVAIYTQTDDLPIDQLRKVESLQNEAADACTIALDPTGLAFTRFAVDAKPTFFVIDASGVIRYRGQMDDPSPHAPLTATNFSTMIDLLLAERPLPAQPTPAVLSNIK